MAIFPGQPLLQLVSQAWHPHFTYLFPLSLPYRCRPTPRKNALECAPAEGGTAHRLGQDEAYFSVREILAEASTAADGVL